MIPDVSAARLALFLFIVDGSSLVFSFGFLSRRREKEKGRSQGAAFNRRNPHDMKRRTIGSCGYAAWLSRAYASLDLSFGFIRQAPTCLFLWPDELPRNQRRGPVIGYRNEENEWENGNEEK